MYRGRGDVYKGQFERSRKRVTVDKLTSLIESITVGCLPKLEEYIRTQLAQDEPKQKRLKTADLYPISGCVAVAKVVRVVTLLSLIHI